MLGVGLQHAGTWCGSSSVLLCLEHPSRGYGSIYYLPCLVMGVLYICIYVYMYIVTRGLPLSSSSYLSPWCLDSQIVY